MNQRALNEQEANWQNEVRELFNAAADSIIPTTTTVPSVPLSPLFTTSTVALDQNLASTKGLYCTLSKLSQELQSMKDEFANKMIGKRFCVFFTFLVCLNFRNSTSSHTYWRFT